MTFVARGSGRKTYGSLTGVIDRIEYNTLYYGLRIFHCIVQFVKWHRGGVVHWFLLWHCIVTLRSDSNRHHREIVQWVSSPVLWRPTKSWNPYNVKLFLTDISATVAQIQKFQKTRCIFFRILLLGGPSPPSQLVPNFAQWWLLKYKKNLLGLNLAEHFQLYITLVRDATTMDKDII